MADTLNDLISKKMKERRSDRVKNQNKNIEKASKEINAMKVKGLSSKVTKGKKKFTKDDLEKISMAKEELKDV